MIDTENQREQRIEKGKQKAENRKQKIGCECRVKSTYLNDVTTLIELS